MNSFLISFDGTPLVVLNLSGRGIIACILDRYAEVYAIDRSRIDGRWVESIDQLQWNKDCDSYLGRNTNVP